MVRVSGHGATSTDGWSAYIDESQSDRSRDPGVYILAATIIRPGSAEAAAREAMLGLRRGRGGKLHWRDEDGDRRLEIISTVRELGLTHLVAVRSCRADERDERRRRLCLKVLCQELNRRGISSMVLESRGPADDRRDLNALQTFRASQLIGPGLRIDHLPGPREPLLWIPDAVCGAFVADRTGNPVYVTALGAGHTVLPA